jgi:hypothetical protein
MPLCVLNARSSQHVVVEVDLAVGVEVAIQPADAAFDDAAVRRK